jgi:hypothetical protein
MWDVRVGGTRGKPTPLDICVAFAGSFLVRIARLFPDELDLKNVARDVEALAKLLSGCEL